MDAFSPVERIAGPDRGALVVCDHASNALPPGYGTLGLAPAALDRHIAYDIGAAGVARRLAALLGAPAILSTFSRLLIDPNRGADDPTLVMRLSDGAIVPGNARIGADEIARRRDLYWRPYREAIGAALDAALATGAAPAILSIHTFTPCWKGTPRPWQAGLLWDMDGRIARPLIAALRAERGLAIGDNEPYDGALEGDTMHELGTARGLPHALIEIRQDLVADEAGQAEWAGRLARLLAPILADPGLRRVRRFGSRAGAARNGPRR